MEKHGKLIAYAAAIIAALVMVFTKQPYSEIPMVGIAIFALYQTFYKEQAEEKAEIAEKKTEAAINAFEDVSQMKYEDYKEIK